MFRHYVIGGILFVTVAAASTLMSGPQGNPNQSGAPVSIVNPLPLPITGTIGLAPGGSVAISNPESNPVVVRDIDEPAREPFQAGMQSIILPDTNGVFLVTVPAKKRLVIEHASAFINIQAESGLAWVSLTTRPNDPAHTDYLPCQAMGNASFSHYFSCSVQTKFYADPGQTVVALLAPATSTAGNYSVFISGYFVAVP